MRMKPKILYIEDNLVGNTKEKTFYDLLKETFDVHPIDSPETEVDYKSFSAVVCDLEIWNSSTEEPCVEEMTHFGSRLIKKLHKEYPNMYCVVLSRVSTKFGGKYANLLNKIDGPTTKKVTPVDKIEIENKTYTINNKGKSQRFIEKITKRINQKKNRENKKVLEKGTAKGDPPMFVFLKGCREFFKKNSSPKKIMHLKKTTEPLNCYDDIIRRVTVCTKKFNKKIFKKIGESSMPERCIKEFENIGKFETFVKNNIGEIFTKNDRIYGKYNKTERFVCTLIARRLLIYTLLESDMEMVSIIKKEGYCKKTKKNKEKPFPRSYVNGSLGFPYTVSKEFIRTEHANAGFFLQEETEYIQSLLQTKSKKNKVQD